MYNLTTGTYNFLPPTRGWDPIKIDRYGTITKEISSTDGKHFVPWVFDWDLEDYVSQDFLIPRMALWIDSPYIDRLFWSPDKQTYGFITPSPDWGPIQYINLVNTTSNSGTTIIANLPDEDIIDFLWSADSTNLYMLSSKPVSANRQYNLWQVLVDQYETQHISSFKDYEVLALLGPSQDGHFYFTALLDTFSPIGILSLDPKTNTTKRLLQYHSWSSKQPATQFNTEILFSTDSAYYALSGGLLEPVISYADTNIGLTDYVIKVPNSENYMVMTDRHGAPDIYLYSSPTTEERITTVATFAE